MLPSSPLRVIVEWPKGLSEPPVIYPLGSSAEESEQVRKFLEERLINSN